VPVVLLGVLAVLAAGCAATPGSLVPQPAPPTTAPSGASSIKAVARLRRDLDAIFSAEIMGRGQWAVVVQSAGATQRLFERNGGKLMMPASNMKIVTLAAAAHAIGWDARFTTTLEASGPIEAGVLHGDLVVRGAGDPTINTRNGRGAAVFATWGATLAAAGITRIDGRIIGDDNLFDDEGLGAGWAWDYLQYGYAAPIGALQYNENVVELAVIPGAAAGAPAVVTLAPGSGLSVANKAVTAPAGTPETITYRRFLDRPVLEVTGVVPLAAADIAGSRPRAVSREVAVINPTVYFVQSLKRALVEQGIAVAGDAVDIDDLDLQPAPGERRVIDRTESPPLGEIAAVMMKVSQNLYADTLLKALGVAGSGTGTVAAGRTAVAAALREWRIDDGSSLVMADGSGLSRYNYVTAELIVALLDRMYGDPRHREAFLATLPTAGSEGTVATRLRKSRAGGNARVKTGSISNVRALSGYVQTRDGEMLTFAILANDFTIPAATVNWIADIAVETLANFTRRP
jgi:D-alanyl-D-alanine carboxypeptidase/D-alanyl-D-alanine-endopeptidase (penicillin-binding protein 4)